MRMATRKRHTPEQVVRKLAQAGWQDPSRGPTGNYRQKYDSHPKLNGLVRYGDDLYPPFSAKSPQSPGSFTPTAS